MEQNLLVFVVSSSYRKGAKTVRRAVAEQG